MHTVSLITHQRVLLERYGHVLHVVVGVHPQPPVRMERNGGWWCWSTQAPGNCCGLDNNRLLAAARATLTVGTPSLGGGLPAACTAQHSTSTRYPASSAPLSCLRIGRCDSVQQAVAAHFGERQRQTRPGWAGLSTTRSQWRKVVVHD